MFRLTIAFELDQQRRIGIDIYDIAGRLVCHLIDAVSPAGAHSVSWQGRDGAGRNVSAGAYLVRFTSPGFSEVRKVQLLR